MARADQSDEVIHDHQSEDDLDRAHDPIADHDLVQLDVIGARYVTRICNTNLN